MKVVIGAVLGIVLFHTSALADTGFLDRTVTLGNVSYRYQVYLTGFSMGGTGVYRIAYRWPTRFAALVAVAGRVDSSGAASYSDQDKEADRQANPFVRAANPFAALAEKIAHVPIRLFHGDADETVPVEQSRRLAAALKAAGAKSIRYDEYAGADHVGAAVKAYGDDGLFTWLFAQRR